EQKGLIQVDQSQGSEEDVFEKALEAGASDFRVNADEDVYEVWTTREVLNAVAQALSAAGVAVASAEMTRQPQNAVAVTDADQARQLMKLLDLIESHDDVQNVYANFEMDDALLDSVNG